MMLCAVGLFTSAFAVNLPMLWIGTILAGLFSVAAQVLIPLATMTVKPEKLVRLLVFNEWLIGRDFTLYQSGWLIFQPFPLESRLCHKWYINASVGLYLKKPPTLCHAYETELWTNFCFHGSAFKAGKATLLRALTGAFAFASVSILYSTIALLLTSAHHLPDLFIGLVPLVGIFGALSTRYIGKYADQGYTRLLTWMGCGLFLVSWICFYFGQTLLSTYVIGFALIQLALALVHTSNQSIIFRLRPDAKSRINAIYMTTYFIGGAAGSALGILHGIVVDGP